MSNARVMVVEDEFLIRWSLCEKLSEAGIEVVEAGDGAEARSAIRQEPDLVLLDLKLPDANGQDLMRDWLAADPSLKVVVMSAHGTPELAEQLVREGARQFVPKPFDLDEMVQLVGRLVAMTR